MPLLVRYPSHYGNSRIVDWELDEQATDATARDRALAKFLVHFAPIAVKDGPPIDYAKKLARRLFADFVAEGQDRLRVRMCLDYNHDGEGDGTYDEVELTLRHDNSGAWRAYAVEASWFQLM